MAAQHQAGAEETSKNILLHVIIYIDHACVSGGKGIIEKNLESQTNFETDKYWNNLYM